MNNEFVAEILRATNTLRSGDPSGATAIIQAALAAGGLASPGSVPKGMGAGFRRPQPADVQTIEGTLAPDALDEADSNVLSLEAARDGRLRKPLGKVSVPSVGKAAGSSRPRRQGARHQDEVPDSRSAVAGWCGISQLALLMCGWRAPLPALRPGFRRRRARGLDRDAARLHAEPRGLRRRNGDERPRGAAPPASRLSGTDQR